MVHPALISAFWRKSSRSGSVNGSCVEICWVQVDGASMMNGVRDSKIPDGPALLVSAAAFAAFLRGARRGEFGTG